MSGIIENIGGGGGGGGSNSASDLTTGTLSPSRIADGSLPIAKTTGLQTALDIVTVGRSDSFKAPIYIENPDGFPKITHPSVIKLRTPIAGFGYMMAYTPFPNAPREDPAITYSNNLVDWVKHPLRASSTLLPAGWKAAQSPVVGWCADTHVVQLASGAVAVYFTAFRTTTGNDYLGDIWRVTTTDGATWTAPVKVCPGTGVVNGNKVSSPAVEYALDGSMMMWTANDIGKIGSGADNAAGIHYRTSADNGATWSAPSVCTFPEHCPGHASIDNMIPWHLDVKWAAGKWHMLLNSHSVSAKNAGRLFYLTSLDGIAWTGDVVEPCIPTIYNEVADFATPGTLTHLGAMFERNYRSCFLPIPGNPLSWRIWVTSASDDLSAPTDQSNVTWNCVLFDNFILDPYRKPITEKSIQEKRSRTENYPLTNGAWRIIGSASNPAVILASTGTVMAAQLAANIGSSGFLTPYPSGSGYSPAYLKGGEPRDTIWWRDKYSVEAHFTYLSNDIEAFFLLGVKNIYTNATGFVGRLFGFGVSDGNVYAVANPASSGDHINVTDGQLVATLDRLGGTHIGLVHKIRMEVTADGGANLLINGRAFRVASGMPIASGGFWADAGNIQPGIFYKYRSGATASQPVLYISRFVAARDSDAYSAVTVPLDKI